MIAVAEKEDREAFARLHAFFAPRLLSWLGRSAGAGASAEELVQETMLVVWRKARLFDPRQAGVATWVFAIARNLRIDAHRRGKSRETFPLGDWDEADLSPDAEARLLVVEREEKVRKAMRMLGEEQATIVRMNFFEDAPQSEIARRLGIPLGTVKSRSRLALMKLRELLEGDT